MQQGEITKQVERIESDPSSHPKIAQRIDDIHSMCVSAKIFLLLQIGSQAFPVGESTSEDTQPSSLVFRGAEDFFSGFQHFRMAELAKAYIGQRMDIEGDIDPVVTLATHLKNPRATFLEHLQAAILNQLSRFVHITAAPDHYNLPPEVFELFLGKWQKYTGNYYRKGTETLDEAEEAAMALACDWMDVPEDGNHLEIGCGGGGQMEYIYRNRKAHVVGITDCPTQAAYTSERMRRCGIANPDVRVVGDYSKFYFDNAFDTVSAVGCLEHIQPARYQEFFSFIYRALKSDGRCFLQTIAKPMYKPHRKGERDGTRFLQQNVFPGFQLSKFSQFSDAAYQAGLWGEGGSNDANHYVHTLQDWSKRLLENKEHIVRIVGEKQFRILLAYIAMGAKAFEEGVITHERNLYTKPRGQVCIARSRYDQRRGCGQWWDRYDYQCRKEEGGLPDCPPLSERIILAKKGPRRLAAEDFDKRWDENFRKKYPEKKAPITFQGEITDLTHEVYLARPHFLHERKPPW